MKSQDHSGSTALFNSIRLDDIAVFKMLLDAGGKETLALRKKVASLLPMKSCMHYEMKENCLQMIRQCLCLCL